ncbi:MAG: beta-N-acetylhexosaminidase family protein, partial [Planctomycetota bacterium]
MLRCIGLCLVATSAWLTAAVQAAETEPRWWRPSAVACSPDASLAERLAAREIRRYVYVRTRKLVRMIKDLDEAKPHRGLIVVGCKDRPAVKALLKDRRLEASVAGLAAGHYRLKTLDYPNGGSILVTGGDPVGVLYGAYRLAEHMGVRFYLHGDVVPDKQVVEAWPEVDEIGKPLFAHRGIQPFHDFPEGPDWWDADHYKATLAQLVKLRMNFFGLHTYPEGGVGPEPLTWIGLADDAADDGTVTFSYRSRHFTTANPTGSWGYQSTKTGDYAFGAAHLFDRDDYAPDTMRLAGLWNEMPPEECNALFNRTGRQVNDAFTFAHRLGIETCLGTETPLTIPGPVKERLKQKGKDPGDPAVVQEVYEGMFRRIMKTHPLDYYWFWTPEGWTWRETKQEQIDATLADFRAALAAAEKVEAPFTLATCGWVLGPAQDRALFDNALPKEMPMSCINRNVGHDPVEPGFAAVEGRPKWAIPWLEDDPAMISPQLWVGRMRKDAVDALRHGCTGLLGIHWRTRILGPNVSALAKAAWDQSGWGP